ncbi:MAG: cupin domain-containing protein [Clostridia bacterium]|nr:cupin domain-containing protein [Clostridia bacterium]
MNRKTEILKKAYHLEKHVEGGSFSESYTAPFEHNGRPIAGSIYFLLEAGEISHFHQIDCDEIWYYHEGCGMRITAFSGNEKQEFLLGANLNKGERACVVIPKGCIFAAENLKSDGFTFISCITAPHFAYSGFRLVGRQEIKEKYPVHFEAVKHLAYEQADFLEFASVQKERR